MGDGFHPFSEPFMRALELKNYAEEIKFKREARDQQRRQWEVETQQQQRNNQMQDLQTHIALQSMGALPVEQGPIGEFHAALGGRGTPVSTPIGTYSLPTTAQQDQRGDEDALRAGRRAGVSQVETEKLTNPYVPTDLGPDFGGVVNVPKKDVANTYIKIYEKRHPNMHITSSSNDKGDLTILGTNPATGEVTPLKTVPGAGKSKATGAVKEALPTNSDIEGLMEKWRPNLYNSRGITQTDIDAANGKLPDGMLDNEKLDMRKAAQSKIEQTEKELRDAAEKEVKARIRNGGGQAGKAPEPVSYQGMTIRKANVFKVAAGKGLTPEEWAKQFEAQGGRVIP